MAAALQAGATHILLLNNDASVNAAAIGALHDAMAGDKHIGMIGPLLYRADTNTLISAGNRDPGRHFNTLDTTIPNTTLKEVDYVSGSVALLSSAMLAQVGLLDEAFFFNTEVADLCMRARKHGWLTVVHTRARAEHDLHRSSALRDTLYAYYIVRNRLLYVRKHLGLRVGWMALWGTYGLALATKLALANKPQQAMAVWLGTRDGLRGRFGGQNARVLAAIGATPP
jgi:GT2 family glycosyltransferase